MAAGSRKRWLITVLVVVLAVAMVSFAGAFAFGWNGGGMGFGETRGAWCHGGWNSAATSDTPLSNDQARAVAEQFVTSTRSEELQLADLMVFDNHFYGQAREAATGRYAYEFLIDRFSGRISLEPGPNMMWNEKYSHMSGGMMGPFRLAWSSESMPVTEDEAVAAAQAYLDRYLPGLRADGHAADFYGYYTLHTLTKLDGEPVGMLSVNGRTGEVWPHTWHGQYVGEALNDHP
jgi:hypothetical protein